MMRLFAVAALLVSSAQAATITDVRVSGAGPVTFGQVFAVGDMKKSDVLVGKLDGATVPLQVDVKATHADGSVRHAIISAIMPKAGTMQINTGGVPALAGTTPTDLPSVVASATIGGVKYSASPSGAFKASWLQGAIANEWQTSAPLTTAAGVAHPHLSARFAIRYYGALKKARVDVTVENDWAYQPAPQNFTYDAEVTVGGKTVYTKAGLLHYHHARWRKMFWYGGDAPQVVVNLNTKYLIASKAVPNYDQSVAMNPDMLSAIGNTFAGARTEPMGVGMAVPYMPTTGGRDDIGILPMWTVAYLLSQDQRARDATMGTADLSGSWPMHYRDEKTDRPISLIDHKAMTIGGRSSDTYNEDLKAFDAFPGPTVAGGFDSPNVPDQAHEASFAYIPYLVTGDYFYLEEMQFFAMWNIFWENPGYRLWEQGLVKAGQARAQAWSLRTLAQAAYITPDDDHLKQHLGAILDSNLNWFTSTYVNNATTGNNYGVIVNGYALSYAGSTGIAPWQDDFITAAIGHAAELGFTKAGPLLAWKAKFPIARMTDPSSCWMDAAVYAFMVKPATNSPMYATFGEAWKASHDAEFNAMACNSQAMATKLGVKVGEMAGYSDSPVGYPSNMQPALAYAVDSGAENAKTAWTIFANRSVKPNYANGSQFNIIPRGFVAPVAAPVVAADAPPLPPIVAPTVPGVWAKVADEKAVFTVPAGTIVRYGAGTSWVYAKGSGVASNEHFGKDPALGIVKTVEAFTPTVALPVIVPPAPPKAVKVTTGSNTKLTKQTGLTVVFLDPVKLSLVKSFTGVTATSKGAFTVSDILLQPSAQYLVAVISSAGKPLDAFLLTVPK